MGFRVLRERGAHRLDHDGAQRHPGPVLAAGDEGGDRVEVLAVGLDGVRRGFPGAAIGQNAAGPTAVAHPSTPSACAVRWGMPSVFHGDNGNYP